MGRVLNAYYDPDLDVPLEATWEQLILEETSGLIEQATVVYAAGQIPRRVSEATKDELALDKKRCHRVLHVLLKSAAGWGVIAPYLIVEPEHRKRGAQLDWVEWLAERNTYLTQRQRFYGTWALKTAHPLQGKQAINRLSNELAWLAHALRD